MTPYVGEAFILKCAAIDNAGEAYYLATVEEVRNGKIVAALVVGPAIYRLGLEDEAVRFSSHRMRQTVQRMINTRVRQASIWFSRDAVLTDILEEIVMTETANDNGAVA
jgi:hypothetical protein